MLTLLVLLSFIMTMEQLKLATTSTGVDVTGVVEATGYRAVEGTSGNIGTDRWIGGDGTCKLWFYNVPTAQITTFYNNTNVLGINRPQAST